MRFNCTETEKVIDYNGCLNCSLYRKGQCEPPSLNLLRQTSGKRYELYYPYQKILRKVVDYLGISTIDIIKILSNKFNLNLDRTTLFKYHKIGLLEKEGKIGIGKSKGVKTFWTDETPLKVYFVNNLINKGITLKEIKKYEDLSKITNPRALAKYIGFPLCAFGTDYEYSNDIMKFGTVMANLAAVKLNISSPSNYDLKVELNKKNPENSMLKVRFTNEKPDYQVVFSKEGSRVVKFEK